MRARLRFSVLAVVPLTLSVSVAAPPPKAIIIVQVNSPVDILQYSASYRERSNYVTGGIHHSLTFRNRHAQDVTAIQFGLVSFDVFNEFLDRKAGVFLDNLSPNQAGQGSWVATALSDFAFLTGLAYVSKVRLEDGTVWQADQQTILAEIRKIQADFDAKLLKEKPGY